MDLHWKLWREFEKHFPKDIYNEWMKRERYQRTNRRVYHIEKMLFYPGDLAIKKIRLLAKKHKREDEAEESKVND